MDIMLRYFTYIDFLSFLIMMAMSVVGVLAIGIPALFLAMNFPPNRKKITNKDFKIIFICLIIGLTFISGLFTFKEEVVYNKLNHKVVLENGKHYLQISESNTFTLYTEEFVKSKKEVSEVIDGIKIIKVVSEDVPSYYKEDLQIKCGDLNYNDCVDKIKSNLGMIVSRLDNNREILVVQF